jgi:hypothetical protein
VAETKALLTGGPEAAYMLGNQNHSKVELCQSYFKAVP